MASAELSQVRAGGSCRGQNIWWVHVRRFGGGSVTWRRVLGDVEGICEAGELWRVVVDVLDGDVQPHVRRLPPVVGADQQGVLGAALTVQLLGGHQVTWFGVDAEAVVGPADDGVGDQSVGTLQGRRQEAHVCTVNFARQLRFRHPEWPSFRVQSRESDLIT